jgi:hypothetical protein
VQAVDFAAARHLFSQVACTYVALPRHALRVVRHETVQKLTRGGFFRPRHSQQLRVPPPARISHLSTAPLLKSLCFSGWICFVNFFRSRHRADPSGCTASRVRHPRIGIATLFRLGSFGQFRSDPLVRLLIRHPVPGTSRPSADCSVWPLSKGNRTTLRNREVHAA